MRTHQGLAGALREPLLLTRATMNNAVLSRHICTSTTSHHTQGQHKQTPGVYTGLSHTTADPIQAISLIQAAMPYTGYNAIQHRVL